MIKREFKVNLKSFIIWISILLAMFIFVYAIYPFIITDETVKSMDELMKVFPPEVLKSFNMDISSISSAYGWVKSEGFMYALLLIGLYASILGMNIVLKEESDKTIEYLAALPIKRSNILLSKVIVSITYIALLVIIFGLVNYICLLLSGDFNQKQFLLLSITPLLIALPFFGLNLFLSMFFKSTKKTLAIPLGFVFISYLFTMISELSTKVAYLKYLSIYTLADTRNVIMNVEIKSIMIIISLALTIVFITLSYFRYNKKELG